MPSQAAGLSTSSTHPQATSSPKSGLLHPILGAAAPYRMGALVGSSRLRGKLGLEQVALRVQGSLTHQAAPSLGPSPRGPTVPVLGGHRTSCAGNLRDVAQRPPAFLAGLEALSCWHPPLLAPQLGGFQDPLAQPLCPGHSGISETSVEPFPLLQLEMWAGLALQCQLPGQLAPEAVAVETQTDVLPNS